MVVQAQVVVQEEEDLGAILLANDIVGKTRVQHELPAHGQLLMGELTGNNCR